MYKIFEILHLYHRKHFFKILNVSQNESLSIFIDEKVIEMNLLKGIVFLFKIFSVKYILDILVITYFSLS